MELTGLWWFFGSLIPWLAFGARWLNFKNRTSPFLIESFVWCFRNSEAFQSLHPGFPGLSFVGRMLGASSATGTGTVGIVQEILELCQGATPFPRLRFQKPLGVLILTSGFWLLWRDVVSILESIAKKLFFETWRLRSKNFAFIMWCFFCTPFWEKEICYREDAPQHAYNSWGAWLSLLGLWRGRGLYSQDRDHSKQP